MKQRNGSDDARDHAANGWFYDVQVFWRPIANCKPGHKANADVKGWDFQRTRVENARGNTAALPSMKPNTKYRKILQEMSSG